MRLGEVVGLNVRMEWVENSEPRVLDAEVGSLHQLDLLLSRAPHPKVRLMPRLIFGEHEFELSPLATTDAWLQQWERMARVPLDELAMFMDGSDNEVVIRLRDDQYDTISLPILDPSDARWLLARLRLIAGEHAVADVPTAEMSIWRNTISSIT